MGPAVGLWRIAATATAQPVYIRTRVPISSATADPSRLLESTWLPYRPLDCPPSSSLCCPRRGLWVAEPDEPPDRDSHSKRTSSCRSACDEVSGLRLSLASVRRTRGRSSSLGSFPDPDISRLLALSCLSSSSGKTLGSSSAVLFGAVGAAGRSACGNCVTGGNPSSGTFGGGDSSSSRTCGLGGRSSIGACGASGRCFATVGGSGGGGRASVGGC